MKNVLYGIAYKCPAGDRKKNCPFAKLDHLDYRSKVNWINELDLKSAIKIKEHHDKCSRSRK